MLKVLLTTDGSSACLKTAHFLDKLVPKHEDLDLTLVFVRDASQEGKNNAAQAECAIIASGMLEDIESELEVALAVTNKALEEVGIEAKQKIEQGNPAAVLAKMAERDNFDLIVIGGEGATASLLGTSAHPPCPVLVVY